MESQKHLFEKFNSEINDLEKKLKEIEKVEPSGGKNQSSQQKQETNNSNPLIDSFKELCGNDNELKDIFSGLGGSEFKDLFAGMNDPNTVNSTFNKNSCDLMGILNNINENEMKGTEMGMTKMFEQVFDVLLKEDILSVPLTTIKTKLEEYVKNNKDKVTEEDKKKYEQIGSYIDELLTELKKPQPHKEHIINVFEKLHTIGELPSEIMQDTEENMKTLNFAQSLFKK